MPNGLASHFIAKYVGPYEILHKPHLDMYTLKLQSNFLAHPTLHILKLKLFLHYDQWQDWKQKVRLEVDAIELLRLKPYYVQGKCA
jgi:hypothetical protein